MYYADLADLGEPTPGDSTETAIYEQREDEAFPV
jgi:hypothetical protein